MKQLTGNNNWPVNLTLTIGAIVTLITALMMSQLDALQLRSAPALVELPVVNAQGVAVAEGHVIRLDAPPASGDSATNPTPESSLAGEISAVSQLPPAGNNPPPIVCGQVPAGWVLHTVQAGETLNTLAIGTQTSADNLREANCLQAGEEVSAGMQILVPQQVVVVACGPPQTWVRYQVRAGETVGQLAASRGVTASEVLAANCLTSSELAAGRFIYLPPVTAAPGSPPIVQPSPTPAIAGATATTQPTATSTNPPPPTSIRPTIPGQPTSQPTATIPVPPTTRPTATPPVVATATVPRPSSTPRPTSTSVRPSSTPPPTSVPPTATVQPPTSTVPPPPTNTSVPPTATVPPPTNTSVPPTATVPPPTNTAVPPTATVPPPPTATDPPPTDEPPTSEPPTAEPPTATAEPPEETTPDPIAASDHSPQSPASWWCSWFPYFGCQFAETITGATWR